MPGAAQSATTPRINQRAGVAQYVVDAGKGTPIQGHGGFVVLHFKALAASASTPVSLQFVAAGADGRNVRTGIPAPLAITVGK